MSKFQNIVLNLAEKALGRTIEREVTLPWLKRPGSMECGQYWPLICAIYNDLTNLQLPEIMPARERRRIDGLLILDGLAPRIIEVDEVQHFNWNRCKTLQYYADVYPLAFDASLWIKSSERDPHSRSGNWAAPKPPLFPGDGGRHRQRAFRDALTDVLPPQYGFLPTLRIAYFEVKSWIEKDNAVEKMKDFLTTRLS